VTLMGDAAHPMYPRGSNGSAQALLDARTLADELAGAVSAGTPAAQALRRYEDQRLPATARVVQTNRTMPPDAIIMKADELSGGQPFGHIDDLISADELRAISRHYQQVAGFALKP
jgi:2-polyprenyl-6-methoxyphenol hydroxylase-like FAD-dependent oxidoreductase